MRPIYVYTSCWRTDLFTRILSSSQQKAFFNAPGTENISLSQTEFSVGKYQQYTEIFKEMEGKRHDSKATIAVTDLYWTSILCKKKKSTGHIYPRPAYNPQKAGN